MILPATYESAVVLLIVAMICWGSWANTQKMTGGRWRFELYYFDFAFGAAVCATIAAFTFGSLDSKELTFQDNLLITGYRNMVYALAAGMVLNLGNVLFTGAVAVSGMSIAFPVGLGFTFATAVVVSYALSPLANPFPLFVGVAMAVVAAVLAGAAYTAQIEAQRIAANKAAAADPNAPPRRRLPRAGRGIALSAIAGILIGLFFSLLTNGAWVEPALSPYGTALLFGAGILISTFIYSPFLMNFPVQGRPVEFKAYLKGGKREHLWGLIGGGIWMIGAVLLFAVANTTAAGVLGSSMTFAIGQGAVFFGTAWGLLAWREFTGAPVRAKVMLTGVFLFFAAAIGAVYFAQLNRR